MNANDFATAYGFTTITGYANIVNANDTLSSGSYEIENVDIECIITTGLSINNTMTTGLTLNTVIIE
jgi:archaellum component FlaF (FlaF/FlaG flagellin family)